MREIKFRAWDNAAKKMLSTQEDWHQTWKGNADPDNEWDFQWKTLIVSQDGHVLESTDEHALCDTHYELQGKPHYELMQYTGLKDKNGREIYEGDILQSAYTGIIATVKFNQEWDRFEAHDLNITIDPPQWCHREIIGNIYENPELLEDKKGGIKTHSKDA